MSPDPVPPLRVLIADDEPSGLKGLRDRLHAMGDMEIVAECRDGLEAVKAIRLHKPDLAFLDIQMPGLDGFEVVAQFSEAELPLVVFVTAYDQYALKAFAVHAVDYLLKPPETHLLAGAIARARKLLPGQERQEAARRVHAMMESMALGQGPLRRFAIREGDRLVLIRTADVEAIQATGNYMHLHCGRASHMIRRTLESLESALDPKVFVRTHKSWLVNVERIIQVAPADGGRLVLTLSSGMQIPVGRHFRAGLSPFLKDR